MISTGADGVYIDVHIQPGARQAGVKGVHGQRLKIAVTEPPESGKANHAAVTVIAHVLGVRRADVSLVSGTRSRRKRVLIRGLGIEEATRLVMDAIHRSA